MDGKKTEGFDDGGCRVVARVISQSGTCDFGHQVGDLIHFNGETIEGRVCLSALYSFLPKIFAMRYGADFPWLKDDKNIAAHACPDGKNPVIFQIERIPK